MLDIWLGIIDLNNVKHLKNVKPKPRTNPCCMSSYKMVRLVDVGG